MLNKKEINEMACFKTRLNMYLESINFADDELFTLSLNLQKVLDGCEYASLSDRDKMARDTFNFLNALFNSFDSIKGVIK